jgi:hypothetical protein
VFDDGGQLSLLSITVILWTDAPLNKDVRVVIQEINQESLYATKTKKAN